jgi:hypothetical protein
MISAIPLKLQSYQNQESVDSISMSAIQGDDASFQVFPMGSIGAKRINRQPCFIRCHVALLCFITRLFPVDSSLPSKSPGNLLAQPLMKLRRFAPKK